MSHFLTSTLTPPPSFSLIQNKRYEAYSQRLAAALQQTPGHPVPLEELVVTLFAVQAGYADSITAAPIPAFTPAADIPTATVAVDNAGANAQQQQQQPVSSLADNVAVFLQQGLDWLRQHNPQVSCVLFVVWV